MDAISVLVLVLGAVCLVAAVQGVIASRGRGVSSLWLAANLLVAATAALTLLFAEAWAAPVTFGLAIPLLILPALLSQAVRRRMEAEDPVAALRYVRWLIRLQPSANAKEAEALCEAAAEVERTDRLDAYEALRLSDDPRKRLWAEIAIDLDQNRWQAILDRAARDGMQILALPAMRALAGLGEVDAMVEVLRAHGPNMDPRDRILAHLHILAAAGRGNGVDALLAGPLKHLHRDAQALTRARTVLATDPTNAAALATLTAIAGTSPLRRLRIGARTRLTSPPPPLSLTPASVAMIDEIERKVIDARRLDPLPLAQSKLTLTLIAINLVVFAVTLGMGALEDGRKLVRLGALWTPALHVAGEWWRLVTAMFLHGGFLHIGLNMFVLSEMGRLTERLLPRWVYLLTYFGSGMGGFAIITWLAEQDYIEESLVVGASGAIFGLIGLLAVTLGVLQWRRPGPIISRSLRLFAVLLISQLVFDVLVPESSLLGHASGFVIGAVIGLALVPWTVRISAAPGLRS